MPQELKILTVNMKSLSQDIEDPIVAGAGDAYGRTFRIIFTQEAAAQFTSETKVYLKWWHQDLNITGYNIFTQVSKKPPVWEIHWPKDMLHEGNVLCRFEIVDSISIAPSVNFIVHVLADPNDGSTFVASDDYTLFQQAVINLTSMQDKIDLQFHEWNQTFETYQDAINDVYDISNKALDLAEKAAPKEYVDELLSNINSFNPKATNLKLFPPDNYVVGESFYVTEPGEYAGQSCETGDLIICVKNKNEEFQDSDFVIVQANINDAITKSDLENRLGAIPADTDVKTYIEDVMNAGGSDNLEAINKAIETSKKYTDNALTIIEF